MEFYVFVASEALADFDTNAWLSGIATFSAHYVNEYGIDAVIFDSLVRGEFHFEPADSLVSMISSWQNA